MTDDAPVETQYMAAVADLNEAVYSVPTDQDFLLRRAQIHALLAIADAVDQLNETLEAEMT